MHVYRSHADGRKVWGTSYRQVRVEHDVRIKNTHISLSKLSDTPRFEYESKTANGKWFIPADVLSRFYRSMIEPSDRLIWRGQIFITCIQCMFTHASTYNSKELKLNTARVFAGDAAKFEKHISVENKNMAQCLRSSGTSVNNSERTLASRWIHTWLTQRQTFIQGVEQWSLSVLQTGAIMTDESRMHLEISMFGSFAAHLLMLVTD